MTTNPRHEADRVSDDKPRYQYIAEQMYQNGMYTQADEVMRMGRELANANGCALRWEEMYYQAVAEETRRCVEIAHRFDSVENGISGKIIAAMLIDKDPT